MIHRHFLPAQPGWFVVVFDDLGIGRIPIVGWTTIVRDPEDAVSMSPLIPDSDGLVIDANVAYEDFIGVEAPGYELDDAAWRAVAIGERSR